jgi:hypothetical protein
VASVLEGQRRALTLDQLITHWQAAVVPGGLLILVLLIWLFIHRHQ